jgi:hypothetical protein
VGTLAQPPTTITKKNNAALVTLFSGLRMNLS